MTGGRRVRRSEFFIEAAMRYFPPGGSVDGRPSFEFFEDGPLRAIETLFGRTFDELPEPYPGIREWTTIEAPFFPPMTFYGVKIVGEEIELVDLTVDEDFEWQSPGDTDYDEPT